MPRQLPKADRRAVTLFGDSVFAGYGLAPDATPAAQLRRLLPTCTVIEAGVPHETSVDGLARLDGIQGDVVLIEFGLNDAIDGVPPDATAANLRAIAAGLKRRSAGVVIVEALVPPTSRWPARVDHAGLAAGVARDARTRWLPDIMAVAGTDRQADGLHPNTDGASRIASAIAAILD